MHAHIDGSECPGWYRYSLGTRDDKNKCSYVPRLPTEPPSFDRVELCRHRHVFDLKDQIEAVRRRNRAQKQETLLPSWGVAGGHGSSSSSSSAGGTGGGSRAGTYGGGVFAGLESSFPLVLQAEFRISVLQLVSLLLRTSFPAMADMKQEKLREYVGVAAWCR